MRPSNAFTSTLLLALLSTTACSSNDKAPSKESKQKIPSSQARDDVSSHSNVLAPTPVQEAPAVVEAPQVMPDVIAVPEPTNLSGFMKRGRSRMKGGELEGALSDYQAAARKAPHAAMPNIQLARTYLLMGDAESAREPIQNAIDTDASSSLAWNTLGRVELKEGDFEAAIVSFQRAVEENEDNSYAWNNLGFAYMEIDSYQEAVDALERATSGGSPSGYMWNNLGMAYEHLDQITSARASYRLAAETGSDKAQANFDRLEGVVSLVPSMDDDSESDPNRFEDL